MEAHLNLLVDKTDEGQYKERLREEIDKLGKSPKEIAKLIDVSEDTIRNITHTNRVGTVRAEYLSKIWDKFPSLDVRYILTGKRDNALLHFKDALKDIRNRADDALL